EGILVSLIADDEIGDRGTRCLVVGHLMIRHYCSRPVDSNIRLYKRSSTRLPLLYTYDPLQGLPAASTGSAPCAATRKWRMLPVSNAILRGVAPIAPGLSTVSVFSPLWSGEPSSKREMVVPINST